MPTKIIITLLLLTFFSYFGFNFLNTYLNKQTPIDESILSDAYDSSNELGEFHTEYAYSSPVVSIEEDNNFKDETDILGKSKSKEKRIEVNLSKQKIYAYEGNKKVMEYKVSTGKWHKTPTGEFKIWVKLRYKSMSGGSKKAGTYYNLPNVPYVMFFYNPRYPKTDGYGIHGTYWHNNFGQPMSHGCINMKTEEAGKLFAWANIDTKVIISGKTP